MYEYIKNISDLADMPAVILLNNGKKKNGVVLDFAEELYLLTDEVRFVCNANHNLYRQTENIELVERFQKSTIHSIDTILR